MLDHILERAESAFIDISRSGLDTVSRAPLGPAPDDPQCLAWREAVVIAFEALLSSAEPRRLPPQLACWREPAAAAATEGGGEEGEEGGGAISAADTRLLDATAARYAAMLVGFEAPILQCLAREPLIVRLHSSAGAASRPDY